MSYARPAAWIQQCLKQRQNKATKSQVDDFRSMMGKNGVGGADPQGNNEALQQIVNKP